MSDEFAGLELALGSVTGYRSWKVTIEGKLDPMSQSGTWVPGENIAVCNAYPSEEMVPRPKDADWTGHRERVEAWKLAHDMSSCQHGFYAYSKTGHIYDERTPSVQGVIQGYGEVLIGTKGFRAGKARIIALSVEPHGGIWNLDSFVVNKLRANYPTIPIFESSFAMQLEFPADLGATEPAHIEEGAA